MADDSHKAQKINAALRSADRTTLRKLATTDGGLLSQKHRRGAWLSLLGEGLNDLPTAESLDSLEPHHEESQMELDINRARPFDGHTIDLDKFKARLQRLISRVLRLFPKLSYYQGLHDVAAVFLYVYGNDEDSAFQCFALMALHHLRDFMMPTINASVAIVKLVPELMKKWDKKCYDKLIMGTLEPFFCLSSVMTIFTHEIRDAETLSLIFDYVIGTGNIGFTIYLYDSLLMGESNKILEKVTLEDDIISREDLVHNALSKFMCTLTLTVVQSALNDARDLMKIVKLIKIPGFRRLNRFSTLKTTGAGKRHSQSIKELERLLSKQLEWEERTDPMGLSHVKNLASPKTVQGALTTFVVVGVVGLAVRVWLERSN